MTEHASIGPRRAIVEPYYVPLSGIATAQVSSDASVNVYIVDSNGRDAYEKGEKFHPIASSKQQRDHTLTARLRFGVRWYLIVENRSANGTAEVEYEVVDDGYGAVGGILSGSIFRK